MKRKAVKTRVWSIVKINQQLNSDKLRDKNCTVHFSRLSRFFFIFHSTKTKTQPCSFFTLERPFLSISLVFALPLSLSRLLPLSPLCALYFLRLYSLKFTSESLHVFFFTRSQQKIKCSAVFNCKCECNALDYYYYYTEALLLVE